MSSNKARIAVLGATGYSGIEAVRYLATHPLVEISLLTSEHYIGRKVSEVHRHLSKVDLPAFEELRPAAIKGRADAVISCLRHKAGAAALAEIANAGVKLVDVAADYRLKDPQLYKQTYGIEHPAPALLKGAVYGLTEFRRAEIREAKLVGNPGCYPTGALLGILPLIQRDLIDPSSILIDAKSGTTGAGRSANIDQIFAEINENARPYDVGTHRHTPEIEQEIASILGRDVSVLFVPNLIPTSRGILSSIFLRPRAGTTATDIRQAFQACYAAAPFVKVLGDGDLPELRNVRATNLCELSFVLHKPTQTLCVMTAIDNLGKGAAGQAIQNLNLMLGFDETAGLLNLAPVP